MNNQDVKRICLWSGPRNISTALMYSFAQRRDTKVFDEPLYAHYLSNTNAKEYHPGAKEVMETMENEGDKVIDMILSKKDKPVLFFKHMTHHLLALNKSFLHKVQNVILTRDPIDMLPSYAKQVREPNMTDVGYALHLDLIQYFKKENIPFVVLDSKTVLNQPKSKLQKLCAFLEIPFDEKMLSWKAGARSEDGSWAKYWYSNIHKSTGFMKYEPKTEAFPKHLIPLLNEAKPIYEALKKLAI